jgi:putative pyruvate formate lyase activating enzyme
MNYNKVKEAFEVLRSCKLCPRNCGVQRLEDETGFCGIGKNVYISSFGPHYGEESVLVGDGGSGTIFLTGCNLGCLFCQNYEISHLKEGYPVSIERIVEIMLYLESRGCHNINFVTPTHTTPHIMEAIYLARNRGLSVPIVYNCGGYESIETLKLLEGFIEIYMPDAKYMNPAMAKKFSNAEDYPEVMKRALLEMYRQVGNLVVENGLAKKGLLIRHLVMPNNVSSSKEIIDFIVDEISPNSYVNIMEQYRPCYRGVLYPEIARRLTTAEFQDVYNYAKSKGLRLA